MFENLILDGLEQASMSTPELYVLARQRQPQDCGSEPCPHRDRIREVDEEWKHQLRREQQVLKRGGRIKLRHGRWRLRD